MSERTLTLEEIKQVELDILKYLHDLCEQHQIKYFIDFGTLLGAVRHKGLSLGMMIQIFPWRVMNLKNCIRFYKMKIIPTTN